MSISVGQERTFGGSGRRTDVPGLSEPEFPYWWMLAEASDQALKETYDDGSQSRWWSNR